MKRRNRILALSLTLAMGLGLLSGCGGGSGNATPAPTGGGAASESAVYRKLYGSEVSTMNYLTTNTILEQTVGANVIDCLVEYDQYGALQPSLAESWTTNDDATVYTFKIRQGVKWVDSSGAEQGELTANDFVTAAAYVLDDAHQSGTAASYFGVVKNAEAYFNYTSYLITSENGAKTTDAEGNAIEPVDPITFEEVGVKALDDYTLEYTLEQPVPYFLSGLTYVCFMPVYGPFLEEKGDSFGAATGPDTLLYCGAYILSDFAPQQTHVYTKNASYWDKDKVYIDQIVETYNSQYNTVGPQMVKTGEIDQADIGSDILDSWLLDPNTADLVSKYRAKVDYSYFYCFNFNPTFDAEYEPENWHLAVNNENFRQSLMAGLDRVRELSVLDPNDPQSLAINSVTPPGFTNADGKEYTQFGDLAAIMARDSFDETKALEYRDAARAELEAAGCTFPVKVLVRYNPATVDWDNDTFTAILTSPGTPEPEPTPIPTPTPEPTPDTPAAGDKGYVTGISVDASSHVVTIATDHIPEYRVVALGDRVAVDLLGAVFSGALEGEAALPVDSDVFSSVRYNQHGDDLGYGYPHTLRVVLDLKGGASYAKNITVEAGSSGVRITATPSVSPELPPIDPNKYTVVLDAGHDGKTLGAVYPDANGVDIYEKDLTLSMVYKLRDILLNEGYNVVLTRDGETAGDLYERSELANRVNADLFVSIHCNSAPTVPTFQGLYTYYYPTSSRSKAFAQAVQDAACAASGAVDRGIASANFVVLRETNMAAVLVETGFMTNVEELTRLCDETYQQKLMEGVARGVGCLLYTSPSPRDA